MRFISLFSRVYVVFGAQLVSSYVHNASVFDHERVPISSVCSDFTLVLAQSAPAFGRILGIVVVAIILSRFLGAVCVEISVQFI